MTPPRKRDSDNTRFWDQPANIRKAPGRFHRAVVRLIRFVLPLAALGLVVVVMAWPQIEKGAVELETKAPADMPEVINRNELLNPRFQSEDSREQPFTITAERAVQGLNNPDAVNLEGPQAEMTLNNGTRLTVRAETGNYIQKRDHLLLKNNVVLTHSDGYEVRTRELLVQLDTQKAWSDTVVEAGGPAGQLSATGVTLETENETLIFTGPAKLVLHQDIPGF